MEFVKKNGRGILFCLMIAVPCQLLGKQFPIVGGAVFAILAGMLITLFVKDKTNLQSGITFVSEKNIAVGSDPAWLWTQSVCCCVRHRVNSLCRSLL